MVNPHSGRQISRHLHTHMLSSGHSSSKCFLGHRPSSDVLVLLGAENISTLKCPTSMRYNIHRAYRERIPPTHTVYSRYQQMPAPQALMHIGFPYNQD